MRPIIVEVASPSLGDVKGFEDIGETVKVKQFVTDPAVKRFGIGTLCRLAGLDELQLNAVLRGPAQHLMACELSPLSKRMAFGSPRSNEIASKTRITSALPCECTISSARAFPGEVVANRQGAELTIVGEPIVHEVERPSLVGGRHRRDERSTDVVNLALIARPNLEPQLAIQP